MMIVMIIIISAFRYSYVGVIRVVRQNADVLILQACVDKLRINRKGIYRFKREVITPEHSDLIPYFESALCLFPTREKFQGTIAILESRNLAFGIYFAISRI